MKALFRGLLGPVQVGTAAWCALGHLTVAQPDTAVVRLAAPASVWWWVLATALAALVGRWRREPLTATPALFATVPWWPVPLPAVFLVWTGRLAWLPVLAAAGIALWPMAKLPDRLRRWLAGAAVWQVAALAGLSTVTVGICAAWSLAPRLPGGDEPHYLVITQSLLRDGDLRIENNHQRGDYREYFGGDLRPDYLVAGTDRQIYSIHAPGTSVLVLPAFALFGYRGAQATMLLIAGLTSALVWTLGWFATGDRRAAWFAWAAVSLSITFVFQSVTIFPDGAGALGVALALLAIIRLATKEAHVPTSVLMTTSVALAALPWLHTRFAVVSAAFGLVIGWRIATVSAAGTRAPRLAAFLACPAVSAAAWFGFFYATYGTPNPAAPYGPNPETSVSYVPGGMLALLFDEQFGLLMYAPALLAVVAAGRRTAARQPLWIGLSVALLYLAVVATYWMWYAGVPATPARFAMAVLPAFAAPVAVGWHRCGPTARVIGGFALATSLAFSVLLLTVDRGALAWNVRFGPILWIEWLRSAADIARGLPSFFWMLAPGDVATEATFARHVLVLVALLAGGVVAIVRLARLVPARALVSTCAGILGLMMLLLQAGWWMNRVSGAGAAASQLELLRRGEHGARMYAIGTWSIGPIRDVAGAMRIRLAAPSGLIPPELPGSSVPDVPAGLYDLHVTARRPTAGSLTLRLARSAPALETIALGRRTTASARVWLPAGAAALVLEPDKELNRFGQSVEAVPIRIDPGGGARAVASAVYGPATVYFVDRAVFPEPDGFWVKGGETAELVVSKTEAGPIVLVLANGGRANDVVIERDRRSETWRASAGESRRILLDGTAAARVRISSPAGFRPAATGTSGDTRYLGVRVTFESGR
ncbi:MAG: hypothetical protein IT184_07305 [Acidobacteria bacterium]|nr:hypothetical protein [Acidobacteriota bacterium]